MYTYRHFDKQYKPKKEGDNSKEYCIGIYADYKSFSSCLLGIVETESNGQEYIIVDEVYKNICSTKEIKKSIEKFEQYADIEVIKINKLPSLKSTLKKYDIETEIKEFLMGDAIFMITSLVNDNELTILNKELIEIYNEEFNNFDVEITSYRINALAIGLTDIAISPNADWLAKV